MPIRVKDDEAAEVRALDLFTGLEDDDFAALMRGAYVQTFPPRIELASQGERSDFLHVVTGGAVEMFASWNGRETVMATLEPVSTFILAATICDAPYLMSARTLEKSRIVLVPSEDVRKIFDINADFARAVVTELGRSYRAVVKSTKNLKLRTSLERLANHLLQRYAMEGNPTAFELGQEKRHLASYLGMTPENLSRAIRQLEPYGVTFEGNIVTITNPEDLTNFAKPSPLIDDPWS
ncbi:MAG: cyclic nucleotide-binding domain-containing protein [Thioclava marina]|jgi:cAMP-binding proteins - catabolite gene activator and regulatory subunit of cAMP-dependent protein kinases|uniref:Transcriptional regulator n=1 Tax=Thioclava marina TaxID=1915077 RepID=A0ABX3MQE9_9RHOB|nr:MULTISPECIES: cyclic nucleotide-binding domain-containing protein [Thioclava]TNE83578.1 MAG: cyclic nucleotide-binding domain-containing protein [Paracoccaceae bacterium]MBC7146916.1 cyclic nucleotide-binding domain-containing protein [Thioclava marina]MBD3802678.1 cyclic nucleotide-binding domain-containing protein [Thioclava sp.]OOY13769.1 transcriptional regulator [Thioclava marina]OOY29478.1 transcriptional regulator [Thioclava sp. L04-15]